MKNLNDREIESVSGGLCENMNIADCGEGSVGMVLSEAQQLGRAVGDMAFSMFDSLQAMGGNFGIWLYNVTHDC